MTRTKQTARGRIHKNKTQSKKQDRGPVENHHPKDQEKRKAQLEKALHEDTAQCTKPLPANTPAHASPEEPDCLSVQEEEEEDTTASLKISTYNSKNATTSKPPQTQTQPQPQPLPKTITIPASIQKSHVTTTISVISSTKITQKVTKALSLLSTYPTPPGEKPIVVLFYAKAQAAAKMISITEIVKREIASMDKEGKGRGGKWFQYNSVEGVVEERKAKREKSDGKLGVENGKGSKEEEDVEMREGGEESEEDAFEVMKTPFERAIEGTEKVRAVPIMGIYLSRTRIESLRREFGEQTNARELPS